VNIPEFVEDFLNQMTSTLLVEEVWLFGSQANGKGNADSDWDLLAIGDTEVLEHLRACQSFQEIAKRNRIHLFISPDRDQFFDPWSDKHGSFRDWNWVEGPEAVAFYDHNKDPFDSLSGNPLKNCKELDAIIHPRWRAYCIWPLEKRCLGAIASDETPPPLNQLGSSTILEQLAPEDVDPEYWGLYGWR